MKEKMIQRNVDNWKLDNIKSRESAIIWLAMYPVIG